MFFVCLATSCPLGQTLSVTVSVRRVLTTLADVYLFPRYSLSTSCYCSGLEIYTLDVRNDCLIFLLCKWYHLALELFSYNCWRQHWKVDGEDVNSVSTNLRHSQAVWGKFSLFWENNPSTLVQTLHQIYPSSLLLVFPLYLLSQLLSRFLGNLYSPQCWERGLLWT
jgi:hypothetical protein